jgi:hypothetical protein
MPYRPQAIDAELGGQAFAECRLAGRRRAGDEDDFDFRPLG